MLIPLDERSPISEVQQLSSDPANLDSFVSAIVDVSAPDHETFEGTVDLARIAGVSVLVGQLGEDAKAMPFEAKQDKDGRLMSFIVDYSTIANSTEGKLTLRFYGFGTPLDVQPPPAA